MRPYISFSLGLALFSAWAAADIHRVPADHGTIGAALSAASSGDTVLVADGVYTGSGNRNLSWSALLGSKHLTVKSENGPANCIIDCQSANRGFYLHNGQNASDVIEGFTIRNGYTGSVGGGIYCYQTSPVIRNNIITGCTATGDTGGGIACESASPLITGNTISGNTAKWGGGIIAWNTSSPVISNNIITGNTATQADNGDGAGIYLYLCDAVVSGNTISDNIAAGPGGGIAASDSSATITGNTVSGNTAPWGAGIVCWGATAALVISDNRITGNTSTRTDVAGGSGIYLSDCAATVTGNIIAANRAGSDGGGLAFYRTSPRISGNLIAGNIAGNGGGGLVFGSSSPEITHNIIVGNSAGQGGALNSWKLSAEDPPAGIVTGNLIVGNQADYGGAFYLQNTAGTLINNTVSRNSAAVLGGGLVCDQTSSPVIVNTIFWADTSPFSPEIHLDDGDCDPPISYCIVDGGQAGIGGFGAGGYAGWGAGNISFDPLFLPVIEGIWTRASAAGVDSTTTLTNTTAGFSPDELTGRFLDPDTSSESRLLYPIKSNTATEIVVYGTFSTVPVGRTYRIVSFRLDSFSPGIDSADGAAAPDTDLELRARCDDPDVDNGPAAGTPPADRGAYERQGGSRGDANHDGCTNILDVMTCLRMALEIIPPDPALMDLDGNGAVDIADLVLLLGRCLGID